MQAAAYSDTVAIKSNTSMKGYLLLVAYVLPAARGALMPMSQLDEGGNYVKMGGGGMRLEKGSDHSNFLALPQAEQLGFKIRCALRTACHLGNLTAYLIALSKNMNLILVIVREQRIKIVSSI